jgi:hypothetical protein
MGVEADADEVSETNPQAPAAEQRCSGRFEFTTEDGSVRRVHRRQRGQRMKRRLERGVSGQQTIEIRCGQSRRGVLERDPKA